MQGTKGESKVISNGDDQKEFSDSQKQGGVGSALLEFINDYDVTVKVVTFEYEDIYIQHGDTKLLEEELEMLPNQLAKKIK